MVLLYDVWLTVAFNSTLLFQALQMLAERDSSLSLHAINIDQVRPDIPEGANIEKAHQEDVVNQPPPPTAAEHPSSGDDETSFNMRARYGQKRNYSPVCCYVFYWSKRGQICSFTVGTISPFLSIK